LFLDSGEKPSLVLPIKVLERQVQTMFQRNLSFSSFVELSGTGIQIVEKGNHGTLF
jgi:hypothetical protein